MKNAEVQINGRYFTYIGEALCPVIVVRLVPGNPNSLFGKRTSYVVRREGESKDLPKSRTAAALRLTDDKFF